MSAESETAVVLGLGFVAVFWGLFRLGATGAAAEPKGRLSSTTPLGVAVPATKLANPQVVSTVALAIRRFRRLLDIGSLGVALLVVGLAVLAPWSAMLAATLGTLIAAMGASTVARRGLLRVKADEHWFAGQPQVRRATVSADAAAALRPRLPVWGYAGGLVATGLAVAYGMTIYDRLPQRMPTHWGFDGVPDSFSDKGVWSVFGPLLVLGGIAVTSAGVAIAVRPVAARRPGDAGATPRQQTVVQRALALVALAVGVGGAVLSVASWQAVIAGDGRLPVAAGLAIVVPTLAIVAWAMWASNRARAADARDAEVGGQEPVQTDDDQHWKAGFIYDNPDDPSVFVPKRTGIGFTVNAGSAGGKIFFAVIGLLVVLSFVIPAIADRLGGR